MAGGVGWWAARVETPPELEDSYGNLGNHFFIGIILIIVESITWLVGGVMMLSEAFGVSSGWGWACLFIPFACFVFAVKHWQRACDPFYAMVIGAVMVGVGAMLIDTVEAAATG